jgi:hypothetical protein
MEKICNQINISTSDIEVTTFIEIIDLFNICPILVVRFIS